jgi:signal transduction histidine kinase
MSAILRDIEEASLRVNETIVSVRELFKNAADQPTKVSIEDVTRQVLRLLQHELQFNEIVVRTEFRIEAPLVHADPAQLQQVVLNLVKNAIDAMSFTPTSSRRLTISTRLDGESSVLLFIQDTGTGVAPQDQVRIFEAFYTTKPAGMGLGLAICRTIVERYEGSLVLAKSSSRGSIFQVALPAIENRGRY